MTNLEGRVILLRQAISPPTGVRNDLEVISGLAQRLGVATGFDTDPEVVFDELRRASAGGPADYSGIDYGRITRELGVFWPCPDIGATVTELGDGTAHPGTPRLFLDRFSTPDGRARFHPVEQVGSAEQPCPDYPFYLTDHRQGACPVPERCANLLTNDALDPSSGMPEFKVCAASLERMS